MKKFMIKFYFLILYKTHFFVAKVFKQFKVRPKRQKFDILTQLSPNLTIKYSLNGYRHFRDYYKNAEIETWNFLARNLDSSGAIIDVGANVGQFSLVAQKILASKDAMLPRIICFEPVKTNYELMKANFEENGLRAESYNLAIGHIPAKESLSIHEVYGRLKTTEVFIIESLDSLMKDLKLSSVQLLKIDTDGFELQVLKGAKQFLEIYKPKILIELNLDVAKELGIDLSLIEFELTSIGYIKEAVFDNENALFISR